MNKLTQHTTYKNMVTLSETMHTIYVILKFLSPIHSKKKNFYFFLSFSYLFKGFLTLVVKHFIAKNDRRYIVHGLG